MIFIPIISLTFLTYASQMAGRRYKYSHVNPGIEAKFLKEAPGIACGWPDERVEFFSTRMRYGF